MIALGQSQVGERPEPARFPGPRIALGAPIEEHRPNQVDRLTALTLGRRDQPTDQQQRWAPASPLRPGWLERLVAPQASGGDVASEPGDQAEQRRRVRPAQEAAPL